jgi:hypothetical protein
MLDQACDRCAERASTYYGANYGNQKFCRVHADEFHAEERERFAAETEKSGGPFPQEGGCPRRGEVGNSDLGKPDVWRYGGGIITADLILTCSYCGSAHPDWFMEVVAEGWEVGATDKSYKAYISRPGESAVAKFYFQHLSHEQRTAFVDLYNARKIRFDRGGGFYRLPFFMVPT